MSDLEALAVIDAVGVLDEAERREYVVRLAQATSEERAAIAEMYDAAAAIATTVMGEVPSPQVKDALLAHLPDRDPFFTIRAAEGKWQPVMAGVSAKFLSVDRMRDRAMLILRLAAGAAYPAHHHSGAEDCYVLSGEAEIEGQVYRAGDFHHADSGSDHATLSSQHGAELLLVVTASDYLHAG